LNRVKREQKEKDSRAAELIVINKEKDRIRRASEKAKTEFISTISHELRTPLTSIKGALGIIKAGVLDQYPDKLISVVDVAYNNSVRLHHLIDEILDIEKIESGKLVLQMDSTNISELLEEAIATNKGYAQEYGVTFVCSGTEQSLFVDADGDRLMQVMGNLLSNAAKFSPYGGQIEVSLARHEGSLRIAVEDHGCGIVEESRETIFDKFTQADATDRRQKGGSGLGLSIATMFVEAHNGKLYFTTKVDKGTTFYIDLQELQGSDNQIG
jgi:signal transduction histidine kinase